jgi:hypothetical protein
MRLAVRRFYWLWFMGQKSTGSLSFAILFYMIWQSFSESPLESLSKWGKIIRESESEESGARGFVASNFDSRLHPKA